MFYEYDELVEVDPLSESDSSDSLSDELDNYVLMFAYDFENPPTEKCSLRLRILGILRAAHLGCARNLTAQ